MSALRPILTPCARLSSNSATRYGERMGQDDIPWSNLGLAEEAAVFKGPTHNARVLSEGWIAAYGFCPSCGATPLAAFVANSPVADFHCGFCAEGYELKAKKGRPGRERLDGAYAKMTARLAARNNPSLMVMRYDGGRLRVTDLIVMPRHVFVQSIIEPKTSTWPRGRSAPWEGCGILIGPCVAQRSRRGRSLLEAVPQAAKARQP